MLSPLPFLGPVGAVRVGRIDGELVVNPTLQRDWRTTPPRPDRRRHEGRPDDGRGRRRAGARGHDPRGARARASRDREALRGAGGPPAPGRQGEVARPRARRRDRGDPRPHGLGADPDGGLREARRVVEELVGELAPRLSMDSTDEDITAPDAGARRACTRCSRSSGSSRSRARCASSSRATCGRSPTPSRTRSSSSRRSAICSSTRSPRTVELPFPVGPGDDRTASAPAVEGLDHEVVRQEGVRGDLQGPRPQEDRGRQAAARRARHRGDPADRGRGRRQPARARLRPVHARPDADPLARSRSAPRRRGSGSTTSRSRPSAATCTTTTSRPTRSGRRASCAARSGATSATARSRSGRSRR